MHVDEMCSFEAAIAIKQIKQKTERWTSIQWKGDPALSYNGAKTSIQCNGDRALSYNGAKTANRKHSFKSSAINWRTKHVDLTVLSIFQKLWFSITIGPTKHIFFSNFSEINFCRHIHFGWKSINKYIRKLKNSWIKDQNTLNFI